MLLKTTFNVPCLLHFMSLVSRVTLDVLNFETSVRFCLVLSVFTFDAVGSLNYSKSPPTDARTISVVFAVALILLKPIASLVLLEYSATAHCWFSRLVSQVCHNTAMGM
jgi:hypothetical protein